MGFFGIGESKPKEVNEWQQATHTQEKTDWTHFLSPEATNILRAVLGDTYNHREAYFKAEDIKNAQLWSAIIELKKQINELNAKIDKLGPREAVHAFKLGTAEDSVVLQKIKEKLQPSVEDTKEATDALVNSLMKF